MADSLSLRGYNNVTKHTGDEMQIVPGRGGPSNFIKWWSNRNSGIKCTIFNVNIGNGNSVSLIVESSADSSLNILHDGKGGFTFNSFHNISRAAVFPVGSYDATEIITEYQFPKLSRGAVLTRILGKLPTSTKTESKPEVKATVKPIVTPSVTKKVEVKITPPKSINANKKVTKSTD